MSNLGSYRKITNSYTNQVELETGAEFISIAQAPLANVNGTEYFPATVKIVDKHGEEKVVSAIVYKSNKDLADVAGGFVQGAVYLASIAKGDERGVIIKLSHLPYRGASARATADMFDFEEENNPVAAPVQKVEYADDNLPF